LLLDPDWDIPHGGIAVDLWYGGETHMLQYFQEKYGASTLVWVDPYNHTAKAKSTKHMQIERISGWMLEHLLLVPDNVVSYYNVTGVDIVIILNSEYAKTTVKQMIRTLKNEGVIIGACSDYFQNSLNQIAERKSQLTHRFFFQKNKWKLYPLEIA
jgi:hypothetical protein